jgi:hypothetical protein
MDFSAANGGSEEMLELLLDRPTNPIVVNAQKYIQQLRLEITKALRLAISEILVIAFCKQTTHHRWASFCLPSSCSAISWTLLRWWWY